MPLPLGLAALAEFVCRGCAQTLAFPSEGQTGVAKVTGTVIARLNALLGTVDQHAEDIRQRVLIVGVGKRLMKVGHFETVGAALLHRQRLHLTYYARSTGVTTERDVSPQRLVHYRGNWYLEAWCHLRDTLRKFSVDSILRAEMLKTPAHEVDPQTLEQEQGPGYGVFTGTVRDWAELRFTAMRARWVATETWHPQQQGRFEEDGRYVLRIPYADTPELVMDILKYGADCEVLQPSALRAEVQQAHTAAMMVYQ